MSKPKEQKKSNHDLFMERIEAQCLAGDHVKRKWIYNEETEEGYLDHEYTKDKEECIFCHKPKFIQMVKEESL